MTEWYELRWRDQVELVMVTGDENIGDGQATVVGELVRERDLFDGVTRVEVRWRLPDGYVNEYCPDECRYPHREPVPDTDGSWWCPTSETRYVVVPGTDSRHQNDPSYYDQCDWGAAVLVDDVWYDVDDVMSCEGCGGQVLLHESYSSADGWYTYCYSCYEDRQSESCDCDECRAQSGSPGGDVCSLCSSRVARTDRFRFHLLTEEVAHETCLENTAPMTHWKAVAA
jgi:hypothetical protein